MNMNDLIIKKRDGGILDEEEIRYFVAGYTQGKIPDYQMSAMLMAIYFKGMNKEETCSLTIAMRDSGDIADLSSIKGVKVDKHSTGGVGDKMTLIAGPIAAACGVPVAKMSGRGLGFTGGTVDKLESVPGFQTTIPEERFVELVNKHGIAVIGQTGEIAPADKKIYALRDVTGTVENISLITSSIMSKKLASGSDGIVLDVKFGDGAFMQTQEEAEELGNLMIEIGNAAGKKTVGLISSMNQPLGRAVGNSMEVIEAIDTLKGKGQGEKDLIDLGLNLAGLMLYAGDRASSLREGFDMAAEALRNGSALEKMRQLIEGQGGDPRVIEDRSLFPRPACKMEVRAPRTGVVTKLRAKTVGIASQHAGAGRMTKEESIDPTAGIYLVCKENCPVARGDVLAEVHGKDEAKVQAAAKILETAYEIGEQGGPEEPVVKTLIGV